MARQETEQKEGTGGTPPQHHVPLEETLARAAALLAQTGQTKTASRPRPPRPATPPPPAAPERSEAPAPTPPPAPPANTLPAEQMPQVGRTLLMATGVTVAIVAAIFLGTRTDKTPLPEPVAADAPVTRAAPTSVTTPPRAAAAPATTPSRRAEVTPRPPREVSVVVERDPRWGQAEIVHTVAPGDTLWSIAERYIHDPWAWPQLAARSGIDNPDLIRPGDQVRIVFVPR